MQLVFTKDADDSVVKSEKVNLINYLSVLETNKVVKEMTHRQRKITAFLDQLPSLMSLS